ncbi:MAG: YceI family protein [Trueperaceae bacterium]|nr:YceI family protein [Trueperaceae bacterium]
MRRTKSFRWKIATLAAAAALLLGSAAAQTYAIDASSSEARYRVREQLAGLSFPNDAVGVTSSVTGNISLGTNSEVLEGSVVTVDVTRLVSDENRRDNFVRDNLLQTRSHPSVTFVPTLIEGLELPLGTEAAEVAITGELTVRGVTRTVTWTGVATPDGDVVRLSASTTFTFADFGISKPRVALVLSVADDITLEIDLTLRAQ